MKRSSLFLAAACSAAVALMLTAGACGTNPNPIDGDAGSTQQDSGTTGTTDAGTQEDGGATVDDAGTSDDAGTADDAGTTEDGGTSDDAGTGNDGGTSGDAGTTSDAGVPTGDGGFAGVTCGSTVCQTGQVCCGEFNDGGATFTCATSCADGGATLACDGPEDCGSAGPICCAQATFGGSGFQPCPVTSLVAACESTCPVTIPFSCNSQGKVVLCHQKADCAGHNPYTECCTFSQNNVSSTFCVTGLMAQGAQSCAQ